MKAYQAHPAFAPAFADELSHFLQELECGLRGLENLPLFPSQIVNEVPSSKNPDDPFYQPEAAFFDACKVLRRLL